MKQTFKEWYLQKYKEFLKTAEVFVIQSHHLDEVSEIVDEYIIEQLADDMSHPKIKYIVGDATLPISDKTIITHCCNDIGAWGGGFVIPLRDRFPDTQKMYTHWYEHMYCIDDLFREVPFALGNVQFVKIPEGYVANLVGQRGVAGFTDPGVVPIRYEAIRSGLQDVFEQASSLGYEVQMPMMGSGLAGGDWTIIEKLIDQELVQKGINVTVLTLT